MNVDIFQVDAFAKGPFTGNPAAVCPLKSWLPDDVMQRIAMENNLSETAFFVPEGDGFRIRWFTPTVEVILCGHATLATGCVLFECLGYMGKAIPFQSKSGPLSVARHGDGFVLDFPTDDLQKVPAVDTLIEAVGIEPIEWYTGREDYLLIYDNAEVVKQITPDFNKIRQVGGRGVIISAPGNDVDFISRGFFPSAGIDEDPATGSAHTTLTPYWSSALGKKHLHAIQWSERKGYFECVHENERTKIAGQCYLYLRGEIHI